MGKLHGILRAAVCTIHASCLSYADMKNILNITHPTLLLDSEKCRKNIDRLCTKMAHRGISFRPHFKTHQSREIGRWFRDYNVDKITVSSLRMAHYFADDGWIDITVAFPVNLLEKEIINALAGRIHLNLLAEDPDVLGQLDGLLHHQVGIFLKMDTGTHRTGIDPINIGQVDACVRAIEKSTHLVWKGFLSHAGHTYKVQHQIPEMNKIYSQSLQGLQVLKEHYRTRYPDIQISFGDTPGASIMDDFSGIDEMRPGNFVFYDIMQVQIGSCTAEDVAVALICPVVVCHQHRQECIIYGGGIHFSKDSILRDDNTSTFGMLVPYVDGIWDSSREIGYIRSLSQEHGVIQVSVDEFHKIRPGQLVSILPVHSCMTAQCMGGYLDQSGRRVDHFASSVYYLQ